MQNRMFAYVRVSTLKQSDGTSLDAQKESIQYYADRNGLEIIQWFEEKQTAAKIGRVQFNEMLKQLQKNKADGVIFHKIDRSTRNHADWSRLVDLRDFHGIRFHFSAEGIDMTSRGGMLTADIQVAIAKDYIANLREEAKKGLYARLRQGIYPFGAPIGYLNSGKGKVKVSDPEKAPLVQHAFDLYAHQNYSLDSLRLELAKQGLKTASGKPIGKNVLARMLHNPFYIGIMKVKEQSFTGKHEPLINTSLFQKVQDKLQGKTVCAKVKHKYQFRQLIHCNCGRMLTAETQKMRVYYRCHNANCPETTIREDRVFFCVLRFIFHLQKHNIIAKRWRESIQAKQNTIIDNKEKIKISQEMQLKQLETRIEKLTNAMLEELVDTDYFLEKKEKYLKQKQRLNEQIQGGESDGSKKLMHQLQMFELPETLSYAYFQANEHEKRALLKKTSSNFSLVGGRLILEPKYPLNLLFINQTVPIGAQEWYSTRRYSAKVQLHQEFLRDYKLWKALKVDWTDWEK